MINVSLTRKPSVDKKRIKKTHTTRTKHTAPANQTKAAAQGISKRKWMKSEWRRKWLCWQFEENSRRQRLPFCKQFSQIVKEFETVWLSLSFFLNFDANRITLGAVRRRHTRLISFFLSINGYLLSRFKMMKEFALVRLFRHCGEQISSYVSILVQFLIGIS